MYASRLSTRSAQAAKPRNLTRAARNARFQSTSSGPSPNANPGSHPGVTGAVAGGASALVVGYAWYHFSGVKSAVQISQQIRDYANSGVQKLKESTPEPNEALNYLRSTASSYAAFVPGAKQYVDGAFDQLDAIRQKHGDEVDKIVRDAYTELQGVAKGGLSLDNAQKAWVILQKHLKRIGRLAGDAAQDIIDQNPQLKDKVGGSLDQLRQMGEQYGPEAKKQVDQTWDQISDIVKGGVSVDTADKIKNLVQERREALKKAGDEAWQKGLEQAKPYLDKNPKVKELIENNADALKQGNLKELWDTVREATNSGDVQKIQEKIQSQVDKVKSQGFGGLEQYFNMIPGGSQILPKLQLLQEVAQKRGKDAEQLLKETGDELTQVLNQKAEKAQKLKEEAKEDAEKKR
ncbi:hypothetical protein MPH_05245 [Macrophomina phaseolina MS6]|uniref:Apolipoprotein/apolipophorin n=1 Tax=Macrophomina phaseolina (strain MS6) TaxID=1126212 RepID=K2RS32_MACPH|nr:hypothetical protein MPH_05245 [Macrophomina phaseolina MS6]